MKLSELISQLQALQEARGDLDCFVEDDSLYSAPRGDHYPEVVKLRELAPHQRAGVPFPEDPDYEFVEL